MGKEEKIEAATLHSAMAKAFAEIEDAKKDGTNPHFNAKFASLNSVIEAVKPHLVQHGLWFSQATEPAERGVTVETCVHHESGESMGFGKLFVPANKQDAQGFGSALTYARRYSLQTAFGIGAEDDDGNAAVKAGKEASAKDTPITQQQIDLINTLCGPAGRTVSQIEAAHEVDKLSELTEKQAAAAIRRLQDYAKEPANA